MDYEAVFYIFAYDDIYHTMDDEAIFHKYAYEYVVKHHRNTIINMCHTLQQIVSLDHHTQVKSNISRIRIEIMNKNR